MHEDTSITSAMDTLPASDRDAIVLRYFEQKDFGAVGAALGMSDDSAQKKVSRAVEKLRGVLGSRGVASTGGALASLLALYSVEAAPAALAERISAHSLAGAATGGRTLGEALAGLSTAARIQGSVVLVALAAMAGLAVPLRMPPETPGAPAPPDVVETSIAPASAVDVSRPAPAPPATEPMDVDALVAAAAAEWRGGREGVTATAKALGFLGRITPAEMPRALEVTATLADEPARALLTRHLLSHWAESEPRDAMAWATSEASQSHRADVVQGILNAWAGRDPEAVMGWHGKTSTALRTRLSESVIATVFRTLARDDPATALAGDYTLHEWGTFTAVIGSDGTHLDGVEREDAPLPGFVYHLDTQRAVDARMTKGLAFDRTFAHVNVRLETPVLYFYTDHSFDAQVDVGFKGGMIGQWFPDRSAGEPRQPEELLDFAQPREGSIRWNVRVEPPGEDQAARVFREGELPCWLFPRLPDSALVTNAKNETEKYLFYRGLGRMELPLVLTASDQELQAVNTGKETVPQWLVFERDYGRGARWWLNGPITPTAGVEIHYDDDRAERWSRDGEMMAVRHWFPGAKMPEAPAVAGVAERIGAPIAPVIETEPQAALSEGGNPGAVR